MELSQRQKLNPSYSLRAFSNFLGLAPAVVSEIIRGSILRNYQKEVPYSVEVEVESFKETGDLLRIRSIIYVERESQKGILIGHQGKALKKVGTQARSDIEDFFGKKVYLETFVKVKKDWRNDDRILKQFGYKK